MAGRQAILTLASTSPQRRAILEQLRIPFTAVAPAYVEHDPPDADPVTLVRDHAEGKARSVHVGSAVTLGVDTTVHLAGRVYGKPAGHGDALAMLRELSGRTHEVLSGLCLLAPGVAAVDHEVTRVTFRPLGDVELDAYIESGEWMGRAGAYAIQGLGGRLVERIEGDYLNVVGLPGALLVTLLRRHAPDLLAPGACPRSAPGRLTGVTHCDAASSVAPICPDIGAPCVLASQHVPRAIHRGHFLDRPRDS